VETRTIPKIVGGIDRQSGELAAALYAKAFTKVHTVRDAATAEAVKITENIFRAVNIALVNELKIAYSKMGIDVWDVIDAAKTKPFGFMAFYPGPGLGGHCIPIDPFYLSWKARTVGVETRFIELAGEVNRAMPQYVVDALVEGLNSRLSRALNGAKILIVGLAYKKNVDDTRESPAFAIMELLNARGAKLSYYDPHCPVVPVTREHAQFAGMKSVSWDAETLASFDASVIVTDHDDVDYGLLATHARLVLDTRNAMRAVRSRNVNILSA
jgi:UDP-N-acetyl-D-glucosamine dehydrogenase